MALELPQDAFTISQKAKLDVQRLSGQTDPFLPRSYLGSIISGLCNRVFEFYHALEEVELEVTPATAIRNLFRWGNIWGVNRLDGSPSKGSVYVEPSFLTLGVLIPSTSRMVGSSGLIYTVDQDYYTGIPSFSISSLTQVDGVATAVTTGDHGFTSGIGVSITGVNEVGYNGITMISVTASDGFTYTVDPATAATGTGTMLGTGLGVTVNVTAEDVGDEYNLPLSAKVSFETVPADVKSQAGVTWGGIADGQDIETLDAFRARLLDRIQNPVTPFNVAQLTAEAKEEPGVTRVFVQEETPANGQVTTYFMRDLDDDPIPSAAEVAAVLARYIAIKPAHMADADVIVTAPSPQSEDFIFATLVPDTTAMREAITENLESFFQTRTDVGVDVQEDAYRSAIFNTIDPVTGDEVSSFTLTTPTTNLTIASGEIATLGSVTYP